MKGDYIIDIIPLTRLPLSRQQYFSYLSRQKIPVGSLVSIPLFRRELNGIVINNRSDFARMGNIRLKFINKVIEESFLTEKQLKLAEFISDYYFCPLGVVLKFFVPKRMKSRKYNVSSIKYGEFKKIKLAKEQKEIVQKMIKNNTLYNIHDTRYLLFGPASSGKTETIIQAIKKLKLRERASQFLILLPEIMTTNQILDRYLGHFDSDELAILHSKITKGEFYADWQNIKSGKAKIIIGTRMAVLAPFRNLRLIAIEEEQDISFKQWDMNPRYDARIVAEKLAEIHQARLIIISATPSIKTYWRAVNNKIKLLNLPKLNIQNTIYQIPYTNIVDMRKERWKQINNYSPISKLLQSEISYALKNKLQTLLFINRQGMSSFTVCTRCKSVLKCPKCDRALIYLENGTYKCMHCNYKAGILTTCPKCEGTNFKNVGLGTEKIEKEIKSIFPSARIKRVDAESMKKIIEHKKLYQDFSQGKIDILIGTQMITKGWDLPQVGLIGIISADSLFNIPDFASGERAFQNITQVIGRTGRMTSHWPGKAIIQTYNPDNFIIKSAAKTDFISFYQKEVKEREALKYPPFSRLIKLIFQNSNKQRIESETENIYQFLKKLELKNIKISQPHDPLIPKIRGKFRKQLIIKISRDQKIPRQLAQSLKNLSADWIIDVDPISIV
jgi:primosomal protein N' (replication factor Y)